MEAFNALAELCSVVGFVFAVAVWVYERLETKRKGSPEKESRTTYTWIRL